MASGASCADVQLYRAKSEGRNRVFIDQQPVVAVSAEEKNLLFGHLALGEPAWIESLTVDATAGNPGSALPGKWTWWSAASGPAWRSGSRWTPKGCAPPTRG